MEFYSHNTNGSVFLFLFQSFHLFGEHVYFQLVCFTEVLSTEKKTRISSRNWKKKLWKIQSIKHPIHSTYFENFPLGIVFVGQIEFLLFSQIEFFLKQKIPVTFGLAT